LGISGGNGNLKDLVIDINLSIFITYTNGSSIINTEILLIFYIFVKPFLRTFILNTNILIIIE
jgi:hypothetical protein